MFSHIGVYGMTVIAALTAQNTSEVTGVMDVPAEFVARQWDAVVSDIPVNAVKTGMLGSAAIVATIASRIQEHGVTNLVVDPVMVSTSGTALLSSDGVDMLIRCLLPLALIVTPNTNEAKAITGVDVRDKESMELAARRLKERGPRFVLVKGGHLEGDALDVLFDGAEFRYFRSARIGSADVHGTGCVLSAAITASLAKGESVVDAVRLGKDYVSEAIANSLKVGRGAHACNASGLKPGLGH